MTIFLFAQVTSDGNALENGSGTNEESSDIDDDEETGVVIVDGYKAIQLDEEAIVASGLAFEKPQSISFKPEIIAYAEVNDVAPLVSLKAEYEAILAERKILQNNLHNHNKILKRAEALHKAKSLSTRDLEKNRADRDLVSSRLSAMNTRLNSFEYKVKSLWGASVAALILKQDKQMAFDELASHKTSLILLSLPKNKILNSPQQKVFINNTNQRDTALAATYLEQAQHVSNPLYGESYIYLLKSKKTRTGMKLFAWIEENGNNIEGLFISESAVVWYANEPWIYVKQGDALFLRKPLGNARKIDRGWLLEDESLIGDGQVVIGGGQTLLSEEFKWAIPDEDDD